MNIEYNLVYVNKSITIPVECAFLRQIDVISMAVYCQPQHNTNMTHVPIQSGKRNVNGGDSER